MQRGLVCAYPVLRGTEFFDRDWMLRGLGERKLTHVMDFIDAALFLKQNELTDKLALHAAGESGSITGLCSIFQEPYLFETAVVTNPITDLVTHMMVDIETRRPTVRSATDHDWTHYEKLSEFGDPHNRLFYESIKLMSPYHAPVVDKTSLHTDLLVCVDEDFHLKYHARKLICKLRELYHRDNSFVFYQEYGRKAHTEEEKRAN